MPFKTLSELEITGQVFFSNCLLPTGNGFKSIYHISSETKKGVQVLKTEHFPVAHKEYIAKHELVGKHFPRGQT